LTYITTETGTGHTAYQYFVEEYSYTGGPAAFDKDAAFGTASTATPIILPTITPSVAHELLTSVAFPGGTATNPGITWTGAGTCNSGVCDSYILSSTGVATPVSFNDTNNPDAWISMIAAFN
jgi:hypothetical protein